MRRGDLLAAPLLPDVQEGGEPLRAPESKQESSTPAVQPGFATGSILKNSAIIGGGILVHVAAVWFYFAAQSSFNNWGQAATLENSGLDEGMCANFPSFKDFLTGIDYQNLCPNQPMASTLVLGIAAVAAEINHMWLPAIFLLSTVPVASSLLGLAGARAYAGDSRNADYQRRADRAKTILELVANKIRDVIRMGYFATVQVWLPIALPTVRSRIVDGANGMAQALDIQVQSGADGSWVPYPKIDGYWEVINQWANMDKFPADSFYSQIERYVGGVKNYFLSKPFTAAVTLSAGAFYAWMYVLAGGMVAFQVGLAAGWMAVAGKACMDYVKQQQRQVLPGAPKAQLLPAAKTAATVLRPFSFVSEILEERDHPNGLMARSFASLHKLTDMLSMISIGAVVTDLALKVGTILKDEFFGKSDSSFLSIFVGALWDNQPLQNDAEVLTKQNKAALMSLSFATETLVGLNIYATGAAVMLALTVAYAAFRVYESCKTPVVKAPRRVAPVAVADKTSGCARRSKKGALVVAKVTEGALLEGSPIKGHDWSMYAVGATMATLVVITLVVQVRQLQNNVGHVCATGSVMDMAHLILDREGTVYPNSPNCTDTVRGRASVEASAISWPMFALGGNTLVAMIRTLALLVSLVVHGYRYCSQSSNLAHAAASAPALPDSVSEPGSSSDDDDDAVESVSVLPAGNSA